jgi:hypothetical protein
VNVVKGGASAAESSDAEQQLVEYVVAEMEQAWQQPIEAQDVELITVFKPDINYNYICETSLPHSLRCGSATSPLLFQPLDRVIC